MCPNPRLSSKLSKERSLTMCLHVTHHLLIQQQCRTPTFLFPKRSAEKDSLRMERSFSFMVFKNNIFFLHDAGKVRGSPPKATYALTITKPSCSNDCSEENVSGTSSQLISILRGMLFEEQKKDSFKTNNGNGKLRFRPLWSSPVTEQFYRPLCTSGAAKICLCKKKKKCCV